MTATGYNNVKYGRRALGYKSDNNKNDNNGNSLHWATRAAEAVM